MWNSARLCSRLVTASNLPRGAIENKKSKDSGKHYIHASCVAPLPALRKLDYTCELQGHDCTPYIAMCRVNNRLHNVLGGLCRALGLGGEREMFCEKAGEGFSEKRGSDGVESNVQDAMSPRRQVLVG